MNDRATQKMCEQWQDGVEAVEGGRPDPEEFYAWLAERDRQEREKGRDEVLAMLESDEAALAREYRGRLSNGAGCAVVGEHRGPLIDAVDGSGRALCKGHWGSEPSRAGASDG